MSKTVVGLFSTIAQAQHVKQALLSQGYEPQHINVVANEDETAGTSYGTSTGTSGTSTGTTTGGGAAAIGEKIGSFFRNLTGGDEGAHHHYATGVHQGGALLAVTVNDPQAEEVASLLRQHGAQDIEDQQAGSTTSAATTSTAATGVTGAATGTTIPIVEEQLVVGKREVDRGGVRIYSHVTERPVEAAVTLHDESIHVERNPVNRPATAADLQAATGAVIEMTATGEEAVVGKTSRVVEEVVVGKQSTEHTEAVHDTVRRTEVDVERVNEGALDSTLDRTTTGNKQY